jgi:8-oxo-dGTP pyrophosphatase MutT (NUDIX family)
VDGTAGDDPLEGTGPVEPYLLLDDREVAKVAFLRVLEERWSAPDDEILSRVKVEHPGAVVAVPIIGDDVLLVRQYRTAVRRYLLEIPAGKRDVHGEPPDEAMRRELEEEIAFSPGQMVPLGEFFNTPGFCDEHTTLFLATDLVPVTQRHELRAEERDMRIVRLPLAVAVRMVTDGEIVDAKTICGLLLAARHLGVA